MISCNVFSDRQIQDEAAWWLHNPCTEAGEFEQAMQSFDRRQEESEKPSAFARTEWCYGIYSVNISDNPGERSHERLSCHQKNSFSVLHSMNSKGMIQNTVEHDFISLCGLFFST